MFKRKKELYDKYNTYILNDLFPLPLKENEVPQGICEVFPYILVSCYTTDEEKSRVLLLNKEGQREKAIYLDNRAHVGGISYDNYHNLVFLCDEFGTVSCYPYTEFINNNLTHKTIFHIADTSLGGNKLLEDGNLVCSYLTYFENRLYVGSFNKGKNGLVKIYDIKREKNDVTLKYISEFMVPSQVQGLTFYKENNNIYLFLSQSYGRKKTSKISVLKYYDNKTDYNNITYSLKVPPMLEQISINKNNNLLLVFESGAIKYKQTAKLVTEDIIVMYAQGIISDFNSN